MWERAFQIALIAVAVTVVSALLGVGLAAVAAQIRLWWHRR